ncbi:2'-5' RNA ligase family protein [Lunatibacter salilacus]|uniref:2'-5' RNA ligase family protein n=1 Tax=Lunatibacter salilacus TaxID=2483804 RepID=UPI00131DF588|nr:2'-5' RNA ligase family protein [Lunatibacter salilacus]
MAKTLGKYFIAIVPEGEIQEKSTALKMVLKDTYGIRYGLRSPAHVTLKMPFLWNEKKESELSGKLSRFFEGKLPFEIHFKGVDTFGKRVIFSRVKKNPALNKLQEDVIMYCKTILKQDIELSDRIYTPHMTIAFKDLKEANFSEYLDTAKKMSLNERYIVNRVALLKKEGGKWSVCGTFAMGSASV